jgi:hypothetical protein
MASRISSCSSQVRDAENIMGFYHVFKLKDLGAQHHAAVLRRVCFNHIAKALGTNDVETHSQVADWDPNGFVLRIIGIATDFSPKLSGMYGDLDIAFPPHPTDTNVHQRYQCHQTPQDTVMIPMKILGQFLYPLKPTGAHAVEPSRYCYVAYEDIQAIPLPSLQPIGIKAAATLPTPLSVASRLN